MTRLSVFVLSIATLSASAASVKTCEGKYRFEKISLTFENPLELDRENRTKFSLDYSDYPPGQFGYRSGYIGAARVVDGKVEMKNPSQQWVANLSLDSQSGEGVITYKDFLVQPTNPTAPPITHKFLVRCK